MGAVAKWRKCVAEQIGDFFISCFARMVLVAQSNNNNNLLLTPKRLLQSSALFDYPLLRLQQVVTPPAN